MPIREKRRRRFQDRPGLADKGREGPLGHPLEPFSLERGEIAGVLTRHRSPPPAPSVGASVARVERVPGVAAGARATVGERFASVMALERSSRSHGRPVSGAHRAPRRAAGPPRPSAPPRDSAGSPCWVSTTSCAIVAPPPLPPAPAWVVLLHAAGRVGLARLPRPEALADRDSRGAATAAYFLLLDPIDEFLQGAGFQAPEDLRDGALGQALRGGDFWR